MMDQDIDGQGHIIYINTPGKTYYLSASSCDDRSQWLLALRAYKFNDESKVCSSYLLIKSNVVILLLFGNVFSDIQIIMEASEVEVIYRAIKIG